MGVPIDITLEVPADIAEGLANGTLVRYGSMVRDLAGRVVKNLAEIGQEPGKELEKAGVKAIKKAFTKSDGLVFIGVAVGAAALTGVGVVAVKWEKSRRAAEALNTSLAAYLDAASRGRLTINEVDRLVADLDHASDVSEVDPMEDAGELVGLIEDYTVRLAKASDMSVVPTDATSAPMVRLRSNLALQRDILAA